ncbi:hypothetical protein K435DRAFT_189892 [Dendrothele bispora CBS 962.96]|uniref:Uncharacterized protein n=1 Tax=Dendrothele bispora (strain CBS 962.96) TaxID=1314807 RepID=A0A4S8LVU1_DENBC|nr:hypothetical protein K435DRAFT_189892 [Dendrothele bispora CBS 962.96]
MPWTLIKSERQPGISEVRFRHPLDQLYTNNFYPSDFMERCTMLVLPRSQIAQGPGPYFRADQFKTHSFNILNEEATKIQFLSTHQRSLELLHWRWDSDSPASSGQAEIPILAHEFEPKIFRAAANQCAAGLISGAAINELLDIQFPCYGLVVTLETCGLYAAQA